ncbi:MAG: methylenetetrahydrofolate reductase [Candidatus Parabeggiatoa sp.]|nr:methylenetetrahydrofolate reductase [Candidatus Parabeggiatoa sp.]
MVKRKKQGSADAYFSFIDGCTQRGIDIPVLPGIMPISNF